MHDNSPSNRCWDGLNTYDRTGKPCVDFQFVECTWNDSADGSELPLTAAFFYPTKLLNAAANKWNARFQLNYKKRPVRAVQGIGHDGTTSDAVFGYGAWVLNPIVAPFRIKVSYGDKRGRRIVNGRGLEGRKMAESHNPLNTGRARSKGWRPSYWAMDYLHRSAKSFPALI